MGLTSYLNICDIMATVMYFWEIKHADICFCILKRGPYYGSRVKGLKVR